VLVATTTADELLPNAAPLVAHALSARRAGAIDVGAACTGFLSGLALATAQIEAARAEVVLLVGADLMARITDPDCRHTAALFGDGAGAAVLTAGGDGEGWIGATTLGADGGAGAELIVAERQEPLVRMQGCGRAGREPAAAWPRVRTSRGGGDEDHLVSSQIAVRPPSTWMIAPLM
jgi:3-oxoacyl-[acyl-carrier-protein] synthase III